MKKIIALLVSVALIVTLFPPVSSFALVQSKGYLNTYSDPHFNLSLEPTREMTIEEYVAIVTTQAYWTKGSTLPPVADKYGKLPSSWASAYVTAEVNKGIIDTKKWGYSDKATIVFVARYLSNAKGKYHYDYENEYVFSNTGSLSAEDKMYLYVALDHNLIPKSLIGTDPTRALKRNEIVNFGIPTAAVTPTPVTAATDGSMKELHTYFNDTYWEGDPTEKITSGYQLELLKKYADDLTLVTFKVGYINGDQEKIKKMNNQYFYITYDTLQVNLAGPAAVLKNTAEAIAFCRAEGITPLLGITNAYATGYDRAAVDQVLASSTSMNKAIDEIMSTVTKHNFGGVNMGFEVFGSIDQTTRDKYNAFLKLLKARLVSEGKVLMTSVGANFKDSEQAISFYDYKNIGQISDFVHVILYDDHSDSSYMNGSNTPGEVSNLVRINRVLKYVTQVIPKSKILLGTMTIGVDYDLTSVPKSARDIPYDEVMALSKGRSIAVDPVTGGSSFEYAAGSKRHVVHFESLNGLKQRALISYRYRIGGLSYFYLGSDVSGFPTAVTSLSYAKPEVKAAIAAGLVPNNQRYDYAMDINRVDFCRLITTLIEADAGLIMTDYLKSKGINALNTSKFKDTKDPAVLALNALGLVNGSGPDTFGTGTIKRMEAAAILSRVAKYLEADEIGASLNFDDTKALPSWALEGISQLSTIKDPTNGKSVMGGTSSTAFSPMANYTRQQTMMSLIRLWNNLKKG